MISLTVPHESRGARAASASTASRAWLLGLTLVVLFGGLYLWHYLDRGWVPHDEGTLAQSAERVLAGELPHRDFDDVYTGGLSYLHALAFRFGGVELPSIRRALFVAFLLWLPALYYLASRWTTIPVAVLVSMLAVTLSVPNYSAALPSWYNLFLATIGLAALVRFRESRARRWLVVAGICGGLSILAKIVGVYFLVAIFLTLLAWEQAASSTGGEPPIGRHSRLYSGLVLFASSALVIAVAWIFGRHAPGRALGAFVIPAVVPALLVVEREILGSFRDGRWRRLASLALPVAGGVLGVVVPYLVFFTLQGALGDLLRGVFIDPTRRVQFAARTVPSLASIWPALPPLLVVWWASRQKLRIRYLLAAALTGPLVVLLLRARSIFIYQPVFYSLRWMVLIAVLLGGWELHRKWKRAETAEKDEPAACLFALVATAGLCNLVQFPFAAPIYFLYIAPLGLLALIATTAVRIPGPRPVVVTLAAFYMIFCAAWLNRGFIYSMGIQFSPDQQTETLAIDRGGLRVTPQDKRLYETLTRVVRERARGESIYATPDCPQVYFLTGFRNPTPILFDFFDDPDGRTKRILATLAADQVHLVVLNHKPDFSGPAPEDLTTELRDRYPLHTMVGHFEVRWQP